MTHIRALFFLNSFSGGGAERVCLNLAEQLYEIGIESDFVLVYDLTADYEIPKYLNVFSLKIDAKDTSLKALLGIMSSVWKVNQFISGKEYVLITAHLQPSYLLASLTTVGKRCMYVIHSRWCRVNASSSYMKIMGLRLILKGKRIVTVSKGLETELINRYGIKSKNITTIYNPCKMILKSGVELQSVYKRKYILFMGRLVDLKNPLRALDLYYKGGLYIKFDLVYLGQGPLEMALRERINEYNLEEYVHIAGFQKNSETWIRNASLLLSCSRQEGLPMNLVEALVHGIPVVSDDCLYGPSEILTGELAKYLTRSDEDFDKTIQIISSALEFYPVIEEKYYKKFDSKLIVQIYLDRWKTYFESG